MRPISIMAGLALAASAACAPTAPGVAVQSGAPRECFFVHEVRSFSSNDDRRVYVRTGRDEVFELQTIGCPDVDWSVQIGIAPRGGGSSVCSGYDAELIVPDRPTGRRTCPVTNVRRLSAAELAALPERDRP